MEDNSQIVLYWEPNEMLRPEQNSARHTRHHGSRKIKGLFH